MKLSLTIEYKRYQKFLEKYYQKVLSDAITFVLIHTEKCRDVQYDFFH